ncbi:hypothetical protein K438DRAFT_580551 [Mycena galopus ATCC 62051]|nr:hypothetical protein K438DRAFT_580551 [Mycena galopus ATCC 62051]
MRTLSASASSTGKKRWWGLGGMKGRSSDTGWGCMPRTAHSLATALQRVEDLPLTPSATPLFPPSPAARVLHARLPSWFPDAPPASFSLHRIALADKAAWKDVGMSFGPSTVASALKEPRRRVPVVRDGHLRRNRRHTLPVRGLRDVVLPRGAHACATRDLNARRTLHEDSCGSEARDARARRPSCTPPAWYPARARGGESYIVIRSRRSTPSPSPSAVLVVLLCRRPGRWALLSRPVL